MTPTPTTVVLGSFVLLLFLLVWDLRAGRRIVTLSLIGSVSVGFVVAMTYLIAPSALVERKGSEADALSWGMIGVLYLSMACGIAAQFYFFRSDGAKFSWSTFLKPFLASPIVFLPIAAALPVDTLKLELSFLMLNLVAFQNGFFWRALFDFQVKRIGEVS